MIPFDNGYQNDRYPLVDRELFIQFLSKAHLGTVHDTRATDEKPYPLPQGSHLLQDLGFLCFKEESFTSSSLALTLVENGFDLSRTRRTQAYWDLVQFHDAGTYENRTLLSCTLPLVSIHC
jgi:hypothetical protein